MQPMPQTLEQWTAYLDAEVAAVCEEKGWGRQVRRKWSARERPVSESAIDDYEWKLKPDADGLDGPELAPNDYENGGCYYVLAIDTTAGSFLLQHDTFHAGRAGMHRAVSTFTSIPFECVQYPGSGRLRDFILYLVDRFGPNLFSLT